MQQLSTETQKDSKTLQYKCFCYASRITIFIREGWLFYVDYDREK